MATPTKQAKAPAKKPGLDAPPWAIPGNVIAAVALVIAVGGDFALAFLRSADLPGTENLHLPPVWLRVVVVLALIALTLALQRWQADRVQRARWDDFFADALPNIGIKLPGARVAPRLVQYKTIQAGRRFVFDTSQGHTLKVFTDHAPNLVSLLGATSVEITAGTGTITVEAIDKPALESSEAPKWA